MHLPHKFIWFPRAFCLCWKKHDTPAGTWQEEQRHHRESFYSSQSLREEKLLPPSSSAALGLGVKHQMQKAPSSTAAPEGTKPSRNTRSAQHNVIKVFYFFFLKCLIKHICLFPNNSTEFGLYCVCQQMDQNKWDLSPYDYFNNDRSIQHLPSKRFGLLIKNRKNPIKLSMRFYPDPSNLHRFLQTLPLFMYLRPYFKHFIV